MRTKKWEYFTFSGHIPNVLDVIEEKSGTDFELVAIVPTRDRSEFANGAGNPRVVDEAVVVFKRRVYPD